MLNLICWLWLQKLWLQLQKLFLFSRGILQFGPARAWYLWHQVDVESERFRVVHERDITMEEATRLVHRVHWFESSHKRPPTQDELDYLIGQLTIK